MMKQTTTNTPDEPHEPAAVLEAVPATALDGQAGTGPIAIFYGAARYSFELARQRELVKDYADAMGLNLVTEFHDVGDRRHGLDMLLHAATDPAVSYVITPHWSPDHLTSSEVLSIQEILAHYGVWLVGFTTQDETDGATA